MTTREVFSVGMQKLGVAFNREVTLDVLDVYWEVLSRRQPEDLARGFKRALAECKFFPAPAELARFSAHHVDDVAETNRRLDALFGRVSRDHHLNGDKPKEIE